MSNMLASAQKLLQSYGEMPAYERMQEMIAKITGDIRQAEQEMGMHFSHIVKRTDGSYGAVLLPQEEQAPITIEDIAL